MALHIEDPEIVAEVEAQSKALGIAPEEVVRRALVEHRTRIEAKVARVTRYLEESVWPRIPPDQLGRRLTKEEEEEHLGYAPGEY